MIQSGLIYAAPRENEIYQEDTFDNVSMFTSMDMKHFDVLIPTNKL